MHRRTDPFELVAERIRSAPWYQELETRLGTNEDIRLKTVHGSLGSFVVAAAYPTLDRQILVLTAAEDTERWVHDLRQFGIATYACLPAKRRRTAEDHAELAGVLEALSAYWQERATVLVLCSRNMATPLALARVV